MPIKIFGVIMEFLNSLWRGKRSFLYTFFVVGVFATFLVQFASFYALDKLYFKLECAILFKQLQLIFSVIKFFIFGLESVCLWRSAKRRAGDDIGFFIALGMVVWILALIGFLGIEALIYIGI